jgi:hypothetical protein
MSDLTGRNGYTRLIDFSYGRSNRSYRLLYCAAIYDWQATNLTQTLGGIQ